MTYAKPTLTSHHDSVVASCCTGGGATALKLRVMGNCIIVPSLPSDASILE